MIKVQSSKFLSFILLIVLFISIVFFLDTYNSYQAMQEKESSTVFARSESENNIKESQIKPLEEIAREVEKEIDPEKGIEDNKRTLYNPEKLAKNHQQTIIEKNIFAIKEAGEEVIEEQSNEKEEEKEEADLRKEEVESRKEEISQPVDKRIEIEENKEKEEKQPVEDIRNPFNLQAVSLNQEKKMSVIFNQDTSQTHLIRVEDEIEGYLVKEIRAEEIIMEKDNQEIRVEFQKR